MIFGRLGLISTTVHRRQFGHRSVSVYVGLNVALSCLYQLGRILYLSKALQGKKRCRDEKCDFWHIIDTLDLVYSIAFQMYLLIILVPFRIGNFHRRPLKKCQLISFSVH